MKTEPLTKHCIKSFNEREHCCFGISPFNSYFSEERIRELASWGIKEFKSIHFFVPDVPAVYTLEAQGYSRDKAEWKARRQAQYLKNKITKALISLQVDAKLIPEMILDWDRLTGIRRYMDILSEVTELFNSNKTFQENCLQASRWVLASKNSNSSEFSESSLHIAVKYFLSEIPLFADTCGIVGRSSSIFCYHQRVEFLQSFYSRSLSYQPSANQGFVIVQGFDKNPSVDYGDLTI